MADLQLPRAPQTDDELYWLVQAMWGTLIPRTRVCPDHVSPFEAFADAYFIRNSLDPGSPVQDMALWHGSRGLSGKSFMLSILGLTKAFVQGSNVNLLGGSYAQSTNIHQHMRDAKEYVNAPYYMVVDDTSTLIGLTNKAKIRPLTASQRTVRGPHPPTLLLDEIDEMEQAILDASLGQPMPQKDWLGRKIKPYTVMCSTWQNPDGTFTNIQRRSEEQGVPIYRWCYRESANPVDGWLDEETIESKKRSIPAEMWRVEYELGEPSIGNRAFDSEAVESLFSLPFIKPGEGTDEVAATVIEAKESKDFEEYRFAEYVGDAQYVIGADWAKEQDFTVIVVMRIDCDPVQMVYYARLNRRPYPYMVGKFNAEMQRYNAQGEYDRTGLGNVVADYIDMRAHGFMMTGEKRAAMLSEYVNGVERLGTMRFPKIPSAYLEHKYAQVGDLYSNAKAQGFHLPDTVCAFGLAFYRAIRSAPAASPIVVLKTGEPNRYAKVFARPDEPDDQAEAGKAGDVRIKSEDPTHGVSLLV